MTTTTDAGPTRIRGAVLSSLASHGVTMACNLAAVPLFLHAFGQELYGFWGAVLALTSYLSLLNLGIAQTVSSRAALLSAEGDLSEAARTVWHGMRQFAKAVTIAGVPICVGAWLTPWDRLFDIHLAPRSSLSLAAVLVAGTFLIQLPLGVPRAALTGAGGVTIDRMIGIAGALVRLVVAWCVVRLGLSLPATVLVLFAVNVLASLATAVALIARIPRVWSLSHLKSPRDPSAFRTSSAHYLLLQVAGALVWSSDAFLAGALLDARAAAQIAIAWRVASAALPLGQLVGPAISPALVQTWARKKIVEADALATGATQIAVGVTVATCVSLAFVGAPIFSFWVGKELFVGHWAWIAYCVLVCLQALLAIPDAFVMLAGRHRLYSRWTLVEAGAKTALTVALVPWLGLVGFPLATLLGRIPTSYILLRETARAFESPLHEWVARQLRPSLVAAPAFAPLGLLLLEPRLGTTAPMLALTTLSAALFLGIFWTKGLDPGLRARLLAAARLRRQPASDFSSQ